VEATKLSIRSGSGTPAERATASEGSPPDAEKDRATTVLLEVLAESLRLLHPLLPFVTEEIYGKLPAECRPPNGKGGADAGLLISAPYPAYDPKRADPKAEENFAFLQELVRQIRTLRSECTISPEKKIRVHVRLVDAERAALLAENTELVKLLAGIGTLESGGGEGRPQGSIALVGSGFEAFVYIAEAVDLGALKQKFEKEIGKDRKFIASLQSKLENENFLKNAPAELVAAEKLKLQEARKRTEKLESYIRDMVNQRGGTGDH
jgi:valyl-tRNA synthetase